MSYLYKINTPCIMRKPLYSTMRSESSLQGCDLKSHPSNFTQHNAQQSMLLRKCNPCHFVILLQGIIMLRLYLSRHIIYDSPALLRCPLCSRHTIAI